jgi:hypothetical protein
MPDFVADFREELRSLTRRMSALERQEKHTSSALNPVYSGTPTPNALAYWTGAGTVAGDRAVYVNSGGSVGFGTASPSFFGHFKFNTNGATRARMENSDAGTVAQAGWDLSNGTDTFQMFLTGTGFTPSGLQLARMAYFNANADGGLMFRTIAARDIVFAVNTSTEVLRIIASTAVVSIGGLSSVGANWLAIEAGTSSNDAAAGGVLYVDSGTHANSGVAETDLASYSVPANTLAVNNQELYFEAWGTTAANSNSKTIKLKFGTDVFTLVNASVINGAKWRMSGRITRTGSATQNVQILFESDQSSSGTFAISTAAQTLSGAVTLKLTGTGGATNDVVQRYFKASWEDGNL